MAVMTTSNQGDAIEVYNVRKTLEFAKPKLVYPQFGMPDLLMARKGKQATWIRFDKMAIPGSTLSDDPSWSPSTVTDTTVSATLEFWGAGIEVVEFLKEVSFLDLPDEYKKLIGQNAGETINEKVRDVLVAGTNYQWANGETEETLEAADTADMNDFIDVAKTLEEKDAMRIGDNYVAFISPAVKSRLMKDSAFREVVRYNKDTYFTGELVTIDGIKFLVTSTAPTDTNEGSNSAVTTVENSIVVAEGAYGVARLLPGDFDVVVTPPGGHGDEYKVKTTIAWKAYLKSVILNQNFMVRLRSAK